MVKVKYDDLSMAFDFVSFAGPMEHRAYVSLDTGTIYWISEANRGRRTSGRSGNIRSVHRHPAQE